MKKYNQFITERYNSNKEFEFVIDIRNSSDEDIIKLKKEVKKYSTLDDYELEDIFTSSGGVPVWALLIHSNTGDENFKIKYISSICTPGWVINEELLIITLEDFLRIGFGHIIKYKDASVYNL